LKDVVIISKYSNTVEYNLKTTLDASGLTKLQSELNSLTMQLQKMSNQELISDENKTKSLKTIQTVQKALTQAFNPKLGMLDLTKFQRSLEGLPLHKIQQEFYSIGTSGKTAFADLLGSLGKIDVGLKSTSSSLDKIKNTIGNTVRWGVISSVFNQVSNSIYDSVQYMKDLDSSLTQIMLVTDYSRENMSSFAKEANEAAKALGTTTTAMTNASLVFSQQGFGLEQSKQLAELSTKLANASQQDTSATSDQITAYMNAYGLDNNIAALSSAMDAWAQVANVSAADVAELAQASQKAASTANTVGVSMDQLNGQIAAIESVTREAPEQIGNGLKTLYARFSDLEAGETLEDGVSLGKVTEQLEKYGVQVLDGEGQMRGVGDIMEDLMDVWKSLDQTQKAAVAQTVAGKYQLSRFEALMNRSDLYEEYKGASETAEGTLDKMNQEYVDSLEGKMNQLQTSLEGVFSSLFDTDDFYAMIEALTELVNLMDNFVQSIGGGKQALLGLGSIGLKTFSKDIGANLSNMVYNRKTDKLKKQQLSSQRQSVLNEMGLGDVDPREIEEVVNFIDQSLSRSSQMTEEHIKENNALLDEQVKKTKEKIEATADLDKAIFATTGAYKLLGVDDVITKKEDGTYDFSGLEEQDKAHTALSSKEAMNLDWDSISGSIVTATREADKLSTILSEISSRNMEPKDSDKFYNKLELMSDAFDKLNKETEGLTGPIAEAKKKFSDLFAAALNDAESFTTESAQQMLRELTEQLNLMIEAAEDVQKNGANVLNSEELQGRITRKANLDSDQALLDKKQAAFFENIDLSSALSDIALFSGALGEVIFGVQTLQNLGNIWSDDTLTSSEKMLQTILVISSALPALIDGFKDIGSVGSKAWDAIKNFAIALVEQQSIATASAAANTGVAAATGAVGAASGTAAVGVKAFGKALWTALAPILPFIAGAAALAAALGGIFVLWDKEYNKAARTLEEAQEEAKKTSQALDDAKASSEKLTQDISAYTDIRDAMAEMTEGTQEWNDALKESNEQVLNLLQNYPELAKYVTRDSDGQLSIASEGLDELQDRQAKNLAYLNLANTQANAALNKATLNNQRVELRRNIDYVDNGTPDWGFNRKNMTDSELDSLLDAVRAQGEHILTSDSAIAEALKVDVSDPIVQAVKENANSLLDYYHKSETDDKVNRIAVEEAALQALKLQDGFQEDGGNAKEIAAIVAQEATKQSAEMEQKYQKQFDSKDLSLSDLGFMYQDITGMKLLGEQDGKMQFEDAAGNTKSLDAETMIQLIAAAEAMDNAASHWESLAGNFSSIANSALGKEYSDLGYTVSGGSKELGFDFSDWNDRNLKSLLEEEDLSIEDLGLTQEQVKAAGFENGQAYMKAFLDSAKNENESRKEDTVPDQEMSAEDSISKRLNSVGLKSTDFDQYQTNLRNTNKEVANFATNTENAVAELEEENKELKKTANSSEESRKGLEKNNKAIEEAEESYDKITAKIIESQRGAEQLNAIWDETTDILYSAKEGTKEYNDAIDTMAEGVGHLINIDMSGWSRELTNEFIVENLDDIRAALDGNVEAMQRLRSAAAEKIMIEAGINENSMPEIYNDMLSLIDWANTNLPNIEAGATIDDSAFAEVLNHMIQGAIAAGARIEDILSALKGMGIDAEIGYRYEPMDFQLTVPQITLPNGKLGSGGLAKAMGEVLGTSISSVTQHMQGGGFVPYVKYAKKNNVDNSKGGSYKPSGGGSKGSGSGGGKGGSGGGGGKGYTAKENKDPIDNEIDRYEKVNTKLDAIGADYEKIANEQSRLTGDELAKNLQKQNQLLLQQIELYNEKLKIQQQEANELKNQLGSEYGIQFDSEGFMTNYAQIHQQLIDEVNRIGNQYSGVGSEEAEKALDKQYEAAKKRLETFEELYSRYDELLSSDLKDTTQQIEDLKDAIEDMRTEIFKTSIEALDNIKEIRQELAEFNQSSKIWFDDDPFEKAKQSVLELGEFWDGAIDNVDKYYDDLIAKEQEAANKATTEEGKKYHNDRIAKLQTAKANQGKGTLEEGGTGFFDMQFSNVMDMMKEIEEFEKTGSSTVFGENSAAMYETALEVLKQANSNLKDYKDKVLELRDLIGDMVDEILEKQEERMQAYQDINDELEHQIDLITMIHGEEAYDQLQQAYAAQLTNTKNQISEMSQTLAANKELLAQMEAAGDTSSDAYKALKGNIADTQKELNGLVQSSIENIRKQQELTVKSVTDSWIKDALGTDLDWMQTEWELINRNADYYLDDVNKAYNIQKLQGKYLELLDQSNDVGIQNQITEQMKQQLEYLREKKNLSEYDVQYANAQLEILQKRIALEEAQRNKSQMKLRRDSQGNYSYVYTANEGDVANAQSGLLDAQNNAYNLSKEQMKQTQADSLSALADAKSLIDSIWTNANLSLEEKKKRTETIIGSLKEYLAATSEQLGVAEQNIIKDFLGMCEALTDENKTGLQETYEEIVNGNKDAFDKIDDRWSTSLTGWLGSLDKFNEETDTKFDSLYDKMEEYEDQIDSVGDLVGQNFDDMTGSIQNTVDKTEELRGSTKGFIEDLKKMSGAVAQAEKDMAYYRDKINDANNEMSMYQQKVNELGAKLEKAERDKADMRAEIQQMKDAEAARQQAANGGAGGGNGNGGGSGDTKSIAYGIANSIWVYGDWGTGQTRKNNIVGRYGEAVWQIVQEELFNRNRYGYNGYNDSYGYVRFDTGGYTGTWGDKTFDDKNGKLAVLHQKELILNATDTENILATVSAVRDLVAGLKTQALNGLSTAFAIGGVATKETAQDVNQNVHITAEFPNVSSSSEIENALLNLNERAIQYAFKNN
jgi:TP901 family phage tail tape measure protein